MEHFSSYKRAYLYTHFVSKIIEKCLLHLKVLQYLIWTWNYRHFLKFYLTQFFTIVDTNSRYNGLVDTASVSWLFYLLFFFHGQESTQNAEKETWLCMTCERLCCFALKRAGSRIFPEQWRYFLRLLISLNRWSAFTKWRLCFVGKREKLLIFHNFMFLWHLSATSV